MTARLLLASLLVTCVGCVGFSTRIPGNEEIRNPVPLKSDRLFGGGFDRWACQPDSPPSAPLTKENFRSAWGEPREKVTTAGGETWIYAESGRWCGVLLLVIFPVPVMLPACDTFDRVDFEGDVAVRSSSRRVRALSAGVGIVPFYFPLMPFLVRPGRINENRAGVNVFPPLSEEVDTACAHRPEPGQAPGAQ